MSELISGKEALIALANGEEVEVKNPNDSWYCDWGVISHKHTKLFLRSFFDEDSGFKFRLKPRTITLNGIEVPAPFEPKEGDDAWCISDDHGCGYCCYEWHKNHSVQFGAWRTEDEIKQVVAALKKIFVINNQ